MGISLLGSEVKSCRAGTVSIGEAYVLGKGKEVMLHNGYFANVDTCMGEHETRRVRRVLMHKEEATKLGRKCEQQGYTMVVLKVYFNDDGRVKMEVGMGKGKNVRDKRQDIKNRDMKRDTERSIKNFKG